MSRLPLENIRVIDLSSAWAGAHGTKLLADMGAQVIKVEHLRRPDVRGPARPPAGFGMYPNNDPGERPWNRAAMFNERHRGKMSLTLDLTTPEGKDVFKSLARISDIVLENFSAHVMKRLKLDYEVLNQINPTIIMVSMSGFGTYGSDTNNVSYGATLEAMSGAVSLNGYPDGPPMLSGIHYADPTSGLLAVGSLMAALHRRQELGLGVNIEMAQYESATRIIADAFMEYNMTGSVEAQIGNRHPVYAPHGVYRCTGDDSWIAIEVHSDEEFQCLCDAINRPDLKTSDHFSDALARHHNQDALDAAIEEWTLQKDHLEAMDLLQNAGVRAGALLNAQELLADPHLNDRSFFRWLEHPEEGTFPMAGLHFQLSKTPGDLRRHAPLLGEHNYEVMKNLMGYSNEMIRDLEEKNIAGTVPLS